MSEHPARQSIDRILRDCKIQTTRSSGPGGQHRNKTETAVVITHLSGISGQASERRSQADNRAAALERLRLNLAIFYRTDFSLDPKFVDSQWVRHGRLTIGVQHADFPGLLATVFNCLQQNDFKMAASAQQLGISSAQITKLLRMCPIAMTHCNQQRGQRNLHPLG